MSHSSGGFSKEDHFNKFSKKGQGYGFSKKLIGCQKKKFDTHADVDFDIVFEGGAQDGDSAPQKKVESHNEENVRAVGCVVPG